MTAKSVATKKSTRHATEGSGRKAPADDVWARLQDMLHLLPDYPNKIPVSEIRQRLEDMGYTVHIRTVQRDLIRLADKSYMIESASHIEGGNAWGWQEHAVKLDIEKDFSGHQALAFVLIQRFLDRLLPASTLDLLKPYFETAKKKLELIEKNPHRAGILTWANKIRVVHPTQSLIPPRIDPGVHDAVYESLLKGRQISIVYQKRDSEEPEGYTVNPLGLVQRGPVLILVSTRAGSDEPKNRLMHRISSAQMMNERANRPAGFDLDRYIAEGRLGAATIGRDPIRLVANFTSRAAKNLFESPISEDQSAAPLEGGRVRITATVTATDQLVRWLLGYGSDVEVLEPESLRRTIASIVAEMHGIYPAPYPQVE